MYNTGVMKKLETSVLYNGKMGSTKACMRFSLGRLERDKIAMHKPNFSLVDGIILEITQKEISRAKINQMDSRRKATLKGIEKHKLWM